MDNQTIRQQNRILRHNLSIGDIKALSLRLMSHVQDYFLRDDDYDSFLCYYPFQGEVDLRPLYVELLRNNHQLYFPVTSDDQITFYRVYSMSDFRPGTWEIMEPTSMEPFEECENVLAFTPGVAFSEDGERLGYGGGYYDRFFANHPDITRLGICYEMQLSSDIQVMEWDVPMHYVATEQRVYTNKHNWSF